MHILLTNDDGPPSAAASPYIATFARILAAPPFSHTVSVVLPSTQRSWIGKAHLLPPSTYTLPSQTSAATTSPNETLSDHVTPTYYDPKTGAQSASPVGDAYWVLVPGTPATCAQLGIFHHESLFPNAASHKIDLVLSGPNFGRNTTAAFALSSGTLGGALEAAVCGLRAMALSFAFFTRQEGPALIEEACSHSVRIIEHLVQSWSIPSSGDSESNTKNMALPDIYSINTPLIEGISTKPVKWTWMLDNKWSAGSLYKPQPSGEGAQRATTQPLSFKWSPEFKDIWKTVEESAPGNDGLTIREGCTSVTPLLANFQGLYGKGSFSGELKL